MENGVKMTRRVNIIKRSCSLRVFASNILPNVLKIQGSKKFFLPQISETCSQSQKLKTKFFNKTCLFVLLQKFRKLKYKTGNANNTKRDLRNLFLSFPISIVIILRVFIQFLITTLSTREGSVRFSFCPMIFKKVVF